MAGHNLTIEAELRYINQWFTEWSELQRDDFLPIITEYLLQNGSNGIYMNGIVSGLTSTTCDDKPMSLFQCRAKLFREWSAKWPENIKEKLKDDLKEIDPEWSEKLQVELTTHLTNGITLPLIVEQQQQQQQQQPLAEQNIQNEPLLA